MSNSGGRAALALAALTLLAPASAAAEAAPGAAGGASAPKRRVVDRVVATVEDVPITLVELETRARPFLPQLAKFKDAEREKAQAELMRQMLDVLIAERLIALRAQALKIEADDAAVDRALRVIAEQSKVTVADVLAEVKKQGFTEADYREEIRRSVLEFMVLAREVVPTLRRDGLDQAELDRKLKEAKIKYLNDLARHYAVEDRL